MRKIGTLLLFVLFLVLSMWSKTFIIGSFFSFLILVSTSIPESLFMARKDTMVAFTAPFISILRTMAFSAGLLWGAGEVRR